MQTAATAQEHQTTIKNLWRATFWTSFPFGVLGFLLPIYGLELGASALQIGGMFAAFSAVPALIRPFLGRALDRWGRKPFLLIGLGGYALSILVFSFSDTIALLTAARFLQGLGSAFLWISMFTMLADLSGADKRGFQFGSLDEASYRGAIIGTALGLTALFLSQGSLGFSFKEAWSWLFLAFTVPGLIAFFYGWKGTRETRPAGLASAIQGKQVSRQLLALMGIVFATGASQAMVTPLLMVFLQDRLGAGVGTLAAAYLPAALISSFLPSRMGKLADRWGRRTPMVIGLLIGAASSLFIPNVGGILALAVIWCLVSVGYTVSIPAERALVADIAGEDVRGTSYGLYTFSYFLGSALGPLAGGWLYDHAGHATPFYLNAAVLVIGSALVWVFLKGADPAGREV